MSEPAWIRIQRKTFTRWCNQFLAQRGQAIEDAHQGLERDLSNGVLLHSLLELLSSEEIHPTPKRGAKLKLQKIENLNTSLAFIKSKGIKLVGIGAEDIHDGKSNLVLGLIWTLILRFQIVGGEEDEDTKRARQALLDWCNSVLNPQGIVVTNFNKNWTDGRAFSGLVNALEPGTYNLDDVKSENAELNLNRAFDDSQRLFGFAKILDAVDVMDNPDDLSIMTYISYFRAYMQSNTAYGPNCYAEGPGLTNAKTNEPAPFTVFAVNEEGERAARGGARVQASLVDDNGSEIAKVNVKDNGNGTYSCVYTASDAGAFTLNVLVNKKPIKDSPFRPVIEPSEPNPAQCIAEGDGISKAVAGQVAKFRVLTKDDKGKDIKKGGAHIVGTLKDPKGTTNVDVVDNGDGTYDCSYTPKSSGPLTLEVVVNTQAYGTGHIKDSPFTVKVAPGLADPLNFEWDGLELDADGRRIVVAGKTDSFHVKAKDSFGNPLESGGLKVAGKCSGPQNVPVEVIDQNNGRYDLSYTPTKVGDYDFAVSVDDKLIGGKNNPFKVRVVPSNPSGANSVASGPGISKAEVGKKNPFTIKTFDEFDNPINMGGANVGGNLVDDDGTSVPVEVVDNGDGTYDCSYPTVSKAGKYKLTPTVNGEPVKDAPFDVVVSPGGTALENTKVHWPDKNLAGLDGPMVEVQDSHGNRQVGGKDKIEAELTPLTPLHVTASDNGDGTYTVHWPPRARGQYKVNISVNGQPAPGGPWDSEVEPNPVIPEHQEALQKLLPGCSDLMIRLFADATEEERDQIVRELAAMGK